MSEEPTIVVIDKVQIDSTNEAGEPSLRVLESHVDNGRSKKPASETTLRSVHRCGAILDDEATHCPGCGWPILRVPESIREMATDAEKALGLYQRRVSLAGITTAAYLAGWEDAMAAVRQYLADKPAEVRP